MMALHVEYLVVLLMIGTTLALKEGSCSASELEDLRGDYSEYSCKDKDFFCVAQALLFAGVKAWNAGQSDTFVNYYVDGSLYLGNDLPDRTKQDLEGFMPVFMKSCPTIDLEVLEAVQFSPTRAYDVHIVNYYDTNGAVAIPNIRELVIWHLIEGQWRVHRAFANNRKDASEVAKNI